MAWVILDFNLRFYVVQSSIVVFKSDDFLTTQIGRKNKYQKQYVIFHFIIIYLIAR